MRDIVGKVARAAGLASDTASVLAAAKQSWVEAETHLGILGVPDADDPVSIAADAPRGGMRASDADLDAGR